MHNRTRILRMRYIPGSKPALPHHAPPVEHRSQRVPASRWRRTVTAGVSCVVFVVCAMVLLEVTLRSVSWWYLRSHHWDPSFQSKANAGKKTILCVGESTTLGLWCNVEDSYPKQLERMLNTYEGTDRYMTVVPPHIGQNTSQMAHRMTSYLETYRPRLVILMCGVNNLWSLAESSVPQFLSGSWVDQWRLRDCNELT